MLGTNSKHVLITDTRLSDVSSPFIIQIKVCVCLSYTERKSTGLDNCMHLVEDALGECIMIKKKKYSLGCQLSNVFYFVIDILHSGPKLSTQWSKSWCPYTQMRTHNHVKCSILCQADFKAGIQPQYRETSFSVPCQKWAKPEEALGKIRSPVLFAFPVLPSSCVS